MKQTNASYKVGTACLLLTGAAVGTWAIGHKPAPKNAPVPGNAAAPAPVILQQNTAPAPAVETPALPAPPKKSLSDEMIAKTSALVRKNPGNVKAWGDLGDAYMQKARETADVTYYNHAEQSYQKAVALKPDNVPALNGLAWVNGGRHEFEKSIVWANKSIAADPKNNDAYGLIGDADVEMGRYEAAYKNYQTMLDLRPDTSSYSRGAHLLWLMGDERKAQWLMAKAIKAGGPFAENTAWCRAQLALMLMSTGATLPAEQTVQDALKYTPHNYQLLMAMGRLQAAKKDYPAAIDYYKQAVEGVPVHDALVALGDIYTLTGKPDEARKQYALVEATHKLMKANGIRGDMQIAQFDADHDRDIPEAVRIEETEYKTRPNVYVADTLAWCYYKAGRYKEAQAMSVKAMARNTPEAAFAFHAGMIAVKQHQIIPAKKNLSDALSLNPNFSLLYAPVAADTLRELGSRPLDAEQMPATLTDGRERPRSTR